MQRRDTERSDEWGWSVQIIREAGVRTLHFDLLTEESANATARERGFRPLTQSVTTPR